MRQGAAEGRRAGANAQTQPAANSGMIVHSGIVRHDALNLYPVQQCLYGRVSPGAGAFLNRTGIIHMRPH